MLLNASLWKHISSKPHHVFFLSGTIQLILPALLWLFVLISRYTSFTAPLNTLIPATWAHAFVMLYGTFIFFILGFLMTILPRWMKSNTISKEYYLTAVTWLNIGLLVLEFSLFFNAPTIVSGCIIFLLGWVYSIALLYNVIRRSHAKSKSSEMLALFALALGAVGVVGYSLWLYSDNWLSMQLSFNIGFWLYLMPIFFTLSVIVDTHFYPEPSKVLKSRISLWLFLIGCIGHFTLYELNYDEWLFLVDIPMAALILRYSMHINLFTQAKSRMYLALRMAFLWLFVGLILFGIQSLVLLFTDRYILGNSALHSIALGFFTSLIIAIASPLLKDHAPDLSPVKWGLFLGMQIATATYISAIILFEHTTPMQILILTTAIIWLFCSTLWSINYIFHCFKLNEKTITL